MMTASLVILLIVICCLIVNRHLLKRKLAGMERDLDERRQSCDLHRNIQLEQQTAREQYIETLKQSEQVLKENEQRLQIIFETSQSGIVQVDTQGLIVFANHRMAEMLGSPLEAVIGSRYVDHVHQDERDMAASLLQQVITGKIDHVYTERHYAGTGGNDFWGIFSGKRLKGSDGETVAIIGIITDISERKQMQEIMVQTEKMIMVGGLAAGMAHELNNPLGGILQNTQNIHRRISPGLKANETIAGEVGVDFDLVQQYLQRRGVNELLHHITMAGTRAADIIANLLAFSRKGTASLEPTPLPELINRALELAACDYDLKKKYDFRNIRIHREYDMVMPPIVMNSLEIEQVLLNILKNAAQALAERPSGTKSQITIRTRRSDQYAIIEVEDNGPGMSEETCKRIFDPFFTTKEIGVGTGLGLSVAYALVVNNHRGIIRVDSEQDRGTRFIISLPFSTGETAVLPLFAEINS